jgi:hypothetical protein
MIAFDCNYVLKMPSYMMEAYWTGYLMDLFNSANGVNARMIFVYPDIGAIDVQLQLHTGSDGSASISLTNLLCSFCTQDTQNVNDNAWQMYNAGISPDAASGIAIALSVISRLIDTGCFYESDGNIANFGAMSMLAEDVIEMYSQIYDQTDDSCSELPF